MVDVLHLGQTSGLPASPDVAVLDYPPNPRPGTQYLVRFTSPELLPLPDPKPMCISRKTAPPEPCLNSFSMSV